MTFASPVRFFNSSMTKEILRTPSPFRRIWFHRTEVKERILLNGWSPALNKSSIYGTAIYLSDEKWNLDDFSLGTVDHPSPIDLETLKSYLGDREMFVCVLALQANEVQSCFPLKNAPNGHTEDNLLEYLNVNVPKDKSRPQGIRRIDSSISLQFSRNSGPGNNRQNRRIADYFLRKGIRAINFSEHGKEVVAIFDPNCIRVLPETTDLDLCSFPDILTGDQGLPILT